MVRYFAFLLFSSCCFAKNLKLADFSTIDFGIERYVAEKIIGKPHQILKSDINYYVYNLENSCMVKLAYDKNNKLSMFYFIDSCKRQYKLQEGEKENKPFVYNTDNEKSKTLMTQDFCVVKSGMHYTQVEKLLGKPSHKGFGIIWKIYKFTDHSYMKLWYNNDTLLFFKFVDNVGREYDLCDKF